MNSVDTQQNIFSSNFTPNANYFNNPLLGKYPQRAMNKEFKTKVDPIKCELCDIECFGRANYDIHVQGRKHIRLLNKSKSDSLSQNEVGVGQQLMNSQPIGGSSVHSSELHCIICNVSCLDNEQMKMHLNGSKHSKKLKLRKFEELKLNKDPSVYCEICDQFMTEDALIKHKESGKHKRKNTGTGENSNKKLDQAKIESLGVNTTVENCGFCTVNFRNHQEAIYHYQSWKHISNLQNRIKNFNLWCEICQLSFHSDEILEKHMNGFKHFSKANRGNKNPEGDLGSKLINQRLKMQALKNKKKTEGLEHMDNQTSIIAAGVH